MAGHSKWAQIKHQKAVNDARRGKLFAKLIRGIEVAARIGGPVPENNPTLADAIQRARNAAVPRETIERAIKRGAGELSGPAPELVTYEGYAQGGVAVLVEATTDNRNRTAADVRRVFTKAGGSMADPGSVAYLFHRKGVLSVSRAAADEDRVVEVALEAGAEDVQTTSDGFTVVTAPSDLGKVRAAFEAAGVPLDSAEVTMQPTVTVPLDQEAARKVLSLLDALDDLDDVQNVYSNFDAPEELLAQVG